jgi:MFS family permease
MAGTGYFLYILSYLELMPTEWSCTALDGSSFSCMPDEFCSATGADLSYIPDYDASPDNLYNWVTKLGLACAGGELKLRPDWQIGLIGSVYFGGWALTLLWIPTLSDRYGRLRFFQAGMVLMVLVYTVIMLSKSYWLTIA